MATTTAAAAARYETVAARFDGMAMKQQPGVRFPASMAAPREGGEWVACPVCKGHGGYYTVVDTRTGAACGTVRFCGQCWGYGWVGSRSVDVDCVHRFSPGRADERRQETVETCTKGCGATRAYSSR